MASFEMNSFPNGIVTFFGDFRARLCGFRNQLESCKIGVANRRCIILICTVSKYADLNSKRAKISKTVRGGFANFKTRKKAYSKND